VENYFTQGPLSSSNKDRDRRAIDIMMLPAPKKFTLKIFKLLIDVVFKVIFKIYQ
jgi:hypothetical protein